MAACTLEIKMKLKTLAIYEVYGIFSVQSQSADRFWGEQNSLKGPFITNVSLRDLLVTRPEVINWSPQKRFTVRQDVGCFKIIKHSLSQGS